MKQSELQLSICVFQLVIVVNLPNRGVFQSSESSNKYLGRIFRFIIPMKQDNMSLDNFVSIYALAKFFLEPVDFCLESRDTRFLILD